MKKWIKWVIMFIIVVIVWNISLQLISYPNTIINIIGFLLLLIVIPYIVIWMK